MKRIFRLRWQPLIVAFSLPLLFCFAGAFNSALATRTTCSGSSPQSQGPPMPLYFDSTCNSSSHVVPLDDPEEDFVVGSTWTSCYQGYDINGHPVASETTCTVCANDDDTCCDTEDSSCTVGGGGSGLMRFLETLIAA